MKNRKDWRNLLSEREADEIRWLKEGDRSIDLFGSDGPGIIIKLAAILDELSEHDRVETLIEIMTIEKEIEVRRNNVC